MSPGLLLRSARACARVVLRGPNLLALLLALCAGATPAQLAAQTIAGAVTAQGTGEPISDARVVVVGTSVFTTTGADGRYTLRNVPVGAQSVRVYRIGFQEQKQPVAVAAGATLTVNFVLTRAVIRLQEVVTTATGEQRRVEIGNSVSTINAAERTQTAPITNVASLLQAQSPGVQVELGNTVGSGAQIRIRGISSLSLVNDPIYVVDGVRVTSSNGSLSANIFTGGAAQSRANDLNPDEIESVEVVKGPSAATLYGTDAANGVIVITTKRGRAGAARYTVWGEGGMMKQENTWPTAYFLQGHAPGATTAKQCYLTQISAGTCVADSLRAFNLFTDPVTTPLQTGYNRTAGIQISGGSEAVRFFTSAELQNETGVLTIPQFDRQRFDTLHTSVLDEWLNPNYLGKGSFRANLNATLSPKLDASVSTGFVTSTNRLPQNDNNAYGLLSNAFGGPGFSTSGPGYSGISSLGYQLHGYRANTPGESFQETYTQYINRFIGSTTLNWRPTSWWTNRADLGLDNTGRQDESLCRRGTCSDVGTHRLGYVQDDRASLTTTTANLISTATVTPRPNLNSRTTAGMQWVSYAFNRNGAHGENLTPGATTVSGGASQLADESTTETKTLGLFVEEQLSFNDRLFLTGAVRADQNSAFGTSFQRVLYPKASLSWLVSDERFFPKPTWLSEFRLRTAYGTSGVQPGPIDALQYYYPSTVNIAAQDQPGVQYYSVGNTNLRPERATEFEGGFDSKLFNGRINVELTYYSKLTKDALVGTVIPPSLGTGATVQNTNLGSVKNAGLEALVQAQVVERARFGWDISLNGSTNANKLVSLGTDATGKPIPPVVGSTIREMPGYPLFGYWQRPYTYNDANGDGIITLNEIHVADSAVFVGYSTPRYQVSLANGFDLLAKALRINALFDYKGGNKLLNGTERIRCSSRNNCRGASDPSAPLWQQAAAVAVREDPSHTYYGYMEDASFVRFRELSLTYSLPQSVTAHLSTTKSASLTLAARNLHVWTNYTGLDPESNSDVGTTSSVPSDFQAMPTPTYFMLRLNLGF
ncbi:MAG TPA: SusC/RagA family TonB-linked outer membrane protein [Gemmatimonadaceae bacterium]